MRILDVSPRPAWPPHRGSAVRINSILERLGRKHEVSQFCQMGWAGFRLPAVSRRNIGDRYWVYEYHHPIADAIVEVPRRRWVSAPVSAGWGLSIVRPKMLDQLLDWADVVLIEFPWQFEYCFRRRPGKLYVLATHNVEIEKFRDYALAETVRPEANRWLNVIEKMERRAVRKARLVLAVSGADRVGFIERYGADPAKVIEVPNGADTELYQPAAESDRMSAKRELGLPDKPAVLFMGSDVPPKRVALRWMERLSERTDQFVFLAIGRVSLRIKGASNVRRFGEVDDLGPFLRAADFSLCPVEYGGGTKIKLWEALAAGLPTVVFQESLRGTDLLDGEHVLLSEPSVDSLLKCLWRLTADPELAARLARNGRNHVVAHNDWTDIVDRLEAALVELVEGREANARNSRRASGQPLQAA